MFYVTCELVFSTGGYINDPHRYWYGNGEAMCRSPKRAHEIAEDRARRMCGNGTAEIPVFRSIRCVKM